MKRDTGRCKYGGRGGWGGVEGGRVSGRKVRQENGEGVEAG